MRDFLTKIIKGKSLLPLVVAATFFVVSLLTISDYGINWDGTFRMMRGSSLLHFYETGQRDFAFKKEAVSPVMFAPGEYISHFNINTFEEPNRLANLPENFSLKKIQEQKKTVANLRPSFYQSEVWNGHYWVDNEGLGHLPFPDIMAALSNQIFYQKLGWLPDIESYQLFYLFVCSLGVFLVGRFARDLTDSWLAGVVACLSLALYPMFFGEAHINMKDPVQMTFFLGAVWAFWHWFNGRGLKWFLGICVFVSLAMGTKFNIVFLPLIIAPWLFSVRKTDEFRRWFSTKLIIYAIVFTVVVLLFLVVIWPYSWADPVGRLLGNFGLYKSVGFSSDPPQQPGNFIGPFKVNFYPLILFLTQTPEILLILAGFGIWRMIGKRAQEKYRDVRWLLIMWALVPVVRQIVPGVWFYNGLRQMMESLPALAILTGIGFEEATKLKVIARKVVMKVVSVMVLAVLLIIPLVKYHPNESAYFNYFVGGLSGAQKNNLVDWSLTYGNVYKQGVRWLNDHAEKGARLAHLQGNMFGISPLWLRPDISISPNYFSSGSQKGEYVMSLYDPTDYTVTAKRYLERFLRPVYEVKVDGAVLLSIYENSSDRLKTNWIEVQTTNFEVKRYDTTLGLFYILDLGKEQRITRVTLTAPGKCLNRLLGVDYVFFVPEGGQEKPIDTWEGFIYNERKLIGADEVEYGFPAERGRYIGFNPKSNLSCLSLGKFSSVSYLGE